MKTKTTIIALLLSLTMFSQEYDLEFEDRLEIIYDSNGLIQDDEIYMDMDYYGNEFIKIDLPNDGYPTDIYITEDVYGDKSVIIIKDRPPEYNYY